jgi:hypothetical protein
VAKFFLSFIFLWAVVQHSPISAQSGSQIQRPEAVTELDEDIEGYDSQDIDAFKKKVLKKSEYTRSTQLLDEDDVAKKIHHTLETFKSKLGKNTLAQMEDALVKAFKNQKILQHTEVREAPRMVEQPASQLVQPKNVHANTEGLSNPRERPPATATGLANEQN